MCSYLSGDFIRCEGKPILIYGHNNSSTPNTSNNTPNKANIAVRSRYQCGRDTVITDKIAILHIQTNKKVMWQNKLHKTK